MAIFQFERRKPAPGSLAPIRWQLWWDTALHRAKGLYLEKALHILMHDLWIVADVTARPAIEFMAAIPGWYGDDEHGSPLIFKRLSPREEHDALRYVPPQMLAEMTKYCTCPPNASRKVRRAAEDAFQKMMRDKVRAAEKRGEEKRACTE